MAHLSVEYSSGLEAFVDMQMVCKSLHDAMLESKIFPHAGIRVRAHKADYSFVADGLHENNFVAMTLSVGAGRSTGQLKDAGNLIFAAAESAFDELLATPNFALSMEIREINPELSWKRTPIHARLSGKG